MQNPYEFNDAMKKRGISPVIATVLLVSMVIVIGLIVFLWFRSMTEESITKFGGENVNIVCGRVSFSASYSDGNLYLSNDGNVPIYSLNIKAVEGGNHQTREIKEVDYRWPVYGLKNGGTYSGSIASFVGSAEEIVLIPILMGNSKSGQKTHVCENSKYEIII